MQKEDDRPAAVPLMEYPLRQSSLVRPSGPYKMSDGCDYCKEKDTATHFGVITFRIRPEDLDDLNDTFVLSGFFMYRPIMPESCCKVYQIRFPVEKFDLQKSPEHQEANKKVERLFNPVPVSAPPVKPLNPVEPVPLSLFDAALSAVRNIPHLHDVTTVFIRSPAQKQRFFSMPLEPLMHMTFKKSGVRMNCSTLFSAFVAAWPESDLGAVVLENSFAVFRGFAVAPKSGRQSQSGSSDEESSSDTHSPAASASVAPIKHVLDVNLEECTFSEEKWELFCTYQKFVHGDTAPTRDGFRQMFCESPIIRLPPRPGKGDHPFGLGSAHMTYRLDGKLVGVALLAFLPSQLQSLYFFWDKAQLKGVSLGFYSQLKELELMKEAPALKYYNLGCYVPTSSKLQYKIKNYPGMQVCCPRTLSWIPYDARVEAIMTSDEAFPRLQEDESIADVGTFGATEESRFDFRVRLGAALAQDDKVLDYYDARAFMEPAHVELFDKLLVQLAGQMRPKMRSRFIINYWPPHHNVDVVK